MSSHLAALALLIATTATTATWAAAPATRPATQPGATDGARVRLEVPFVVDQPMAVKAISEVTYQRGKFAGNEPIDVRPVRYRFEVSAVLTPTTLDPAGRPASTRIDVRKARRNFRHERDAVFPEGVMLLGRWDSGFPIYQFENGTPLFGENRIDFGSLFGPVAPQSPGIDEVVQWPDNAEPGDRWAVNFLAWYHTLREENYVVRLEDVGGEAQWVGVEQDEQGQPFAEVQVLLWADGIRHRSHPRSYSGKLEETMTLRVPLGDAKVWRISTTRELSLRSHERSDPQDSGDEGVTYRIYVYRTNHCIWEPLPN